MVGGLTWLGSGLDHSVFRMCAAPGTTPLRPSSSQIVFEMARVYPIAPSKHKFRTGLPATALHQACKQ